MNKEVPRDFFTTKLFIYSSKPMLDFFFINILYDEFDEIKVDR